MVVPRYSPGMPDLDRVRAAAREWLAFVGDLDYSPVVVPFGDPEGLEQSARYRFARVLRDELFDPERSGPIFLESSEAPLRGRRQHWGASDMWRCDEHPDCLGEDYGGWESYRDFVARDKRNRSESEAKQEWEAESIEAHAALHGVEIV